ncbi:MAG: methylmalonyl Co-A mutase-associated GTPase MeaB [Nocardioides sp.]
MSRIADVDELLQGVAAGNRSAIGQAITLVESTRPDDRARARELLDGLQPPATLSTRVGISGVPGVGKSTFIERLGGSLTAAGHRLGVLAVDPSSVRTGGSVLGDKTRMASLAIDPAAFIRPSPTAGTLGGVARATSQSIAILEAAGYDVVLVETVGVGQSEVTVAGMVDTFAYLTLARTGDQLQGIKKGIVELADVVVVNKADGDSEGESRIAARELKGALKMVGRRTPGAVGEAWSPEVLTCSALYGPGVDEVWAAIGRHRHHLGDEQIIANRAAQQWALAQSLVRDELDRRLSMALDGAAKAHLEQAVRAGDLTAVEAADRILAALDGPAPEA